jgi:transglycosylase-like protein
MFATARWVGVVIPFVPRSTRGTEDGSSAIPPASRASTLAQPIPLQRPRPPAPFRRPPRKPGAWHWRSLPHATRVALLITAGLLLLTGATWSRCGGAGCPALTVLREPAPGSAAVRLDALPAYVPNAFVAVEDRRFRRHRGVDWLRVPGALAANVRAGGVQEGFSTITMQLARNAFPERLPRSRRTLSRKLTEMRVAQEIEQAFGKDAILEMYLGRIYFGGGAHGIEEAARDYFGKPAAKLTLAEAATLAGMPKAPADYDPRRHPARARARRDLVLTLMQQQGLLDARDAQAAREAPLRVVAAGAAAGEHTALR